MEKTAEVIAHIKSLLKAGGIEYYCADYEEGENYPSDDRKERENYRNRDDFAKSENCGNCEKDNDCGNCGKRDVVLLFLAGYAPYDFPEDCYEIDAYYTASNSAYSAEKEIIAYLSGLNVSCDFYRGKNLRSLAERNSLGKRALSGFIYCDDYGTYCFIGSLQLSGLSKEDAEAFVREFSRIPEVTRVCGGCGKCVEACPAGAVPNKKEKCLRNIQENARKGLTSEMKDNARFLGKKLLGCGICQSVCPINACVKKTLLPENLKNLLQKDNFEIAIKNNDLKQLKPIIGSNYARQSVLAPILELIKGGNA